MTSGPAPRSALTTDRASDDLSPSVCDRFPEAQLASGISLRSTTGRGTARTTFLRSTGYERCQIGRLIGAMKPLITLAVVRLLPELHSAPSQKKTLRLARKEREGLGHEVGMELEDRAVSGIGIDDEFAVRKAPRQIVRVLAWDHAIAVAVRNEDRVVNL
jgi:hypothetical protein